MTGDRDESRRPNLAPSVVPDLILTELQDKIASLRRRLDAIKNASDRAAVALEALAVACAQRARSWRMKADELYASAESEDDPVKRAALRNLAENYERLADQAERGVGLRPAQGSGSG
jgi:hypothetical protein